MQIWTWADVLLYILCSFLKLVWHFSIVNYCLLLFKFPVFLFFELPFNYVYEFRLHNGQRRFPERVYNTIFEFLAYSYVRFVLRTFQPDFAEKVLFSKFAAKVMFKVRRMKYGTDNIGDFNYQPVKIDGFKGYWLSSKCRRDKTPDLAIYFVPGNMFGYSSSYTYLEFVSMLLVAMQLQGFANPVALVADIKYHEKACYLKKVDEVTRGYKYFKFERATATTICLGSGVGCTLIYTMLLQIARPFLPKQITYSPLKNRSECLSEENTSSTTSCNFDFRTYGSSTGYTSRSSSTPISASRTSKSLASIASGSKLQLSSPSFSRSPIFEEIPSSSCKSTCTCTSCSTCGSANSRTSRNTCSTCGTHGSWDSQKTCSTCRSRQIHQPAHSLEHSSCGSSKPVSDKLPTAPGNPPNSLHSYHSDSKESNLDPIKESMSSNHSSGSNSGSDSEDIPSIIDSEPDIYAGLEKPHAMVMISPLPKVNTKLPSKFPDIVTTQTLVQLKHRLLGDTPLSPPWSEPYAVRDGDWWEEALPSFGCVNLVGSAEILMPDVNHLLSNMSATNNPRTLGQVCGNQVHAWPIVSVYTGRSTSAQMAGIGAVASEITKMIQMEHMSKHP